MSYSPIFRWTGLTVLLGWLVGTACLPAAGDDQTGAAPATPQQTRRPIIDGVPDTNPAHKSVVALMWGTGEANFCSGTLIAPEVVLTAAHCVDTISPSLLEVFFGPDVDGPGERREVVEVMPHPLYDVPNIRYDLGLVRLASPAPADATPIPILPAALGLTVADDGEAVEFVGFGRTENDTSGVRLTAWGSIAEVCEGPAPCSWSGAPIAPYAFAYSMSVGGPCKGDSGGPAFLVRNDQEYVAGVTSYGDEFCDYYGVSSAPDAYAAWIDAFIAGTGEDCATPGDEDADTLADCADPDCDGHAACPERACLAPESLRCGDEITDTTEGGTHHLRYYSCQTAGNLLGPERVYAIEAPRGIDVYVTLHPEGGADLDLLLLPYFGDDCAEWDCLDASLTPGTAPEQISFRARNDHGFIVVDSLADPGAYTLVMACDLSDEDCTNNIDDDADGDLDCADVDCATHPDCVPPSEVCGGGVDEDGDGLTDCEDPDCATVEFCRGPSDDGGCRQTPTGATPPLWMLLLTLLLARRRSLHT